MAVDWRQGLIRIMELTAGVIEKPKRPVKTIEDWKDREGEITSEYQKAIFENAKGLVMDRRSFFKTGLITLLSFMSGSFIFKKIKPPPYTINNPGFDVWRDGSTPYDFIDYEYWIPLNDTWTKITGSALIDKNNQVIIRFKGAPVWKIRLFNIKNLSRHKTLFIAGDIIETNLNQIKIQLKPRRNKIV